MSQKKFLKGAFILTIGGILVRIFGFFFRIILKNRIGTANVGIYEMIMPVFALCFATAVAGFEVTVTRFAKSGKNSIIASCFIISFILSITMTTIVYAGAPFIATYIFHNELCTRPVQLLSLSLPFSCVHSLAASYFIGREKTGFPVLSQLAEQIVRIAAIFVITAKNPTPSAAVLSLVLGEFFSAGLSVFYISGKKALFSPALKNNIKPICSMVLPIASNRILLHILQIAEASLIPMMLQIYGYSRGNSLEIYGIIMGMAIPVILFPAALTNSVAQLLIPNVSCNEKNPATLKKISGRAFYFSIIFGGLCIFFYITIGNRIVCRIFNEPSLKYYVTCLSFISPFIFLSSTYKSMLHAVGRTMTVLAGSMLSELINIFFIVFFIPKIGINAFLLGMVISQCIYATCNMINFNRYIIKINTPE